jgi:hypothetical protein
MALCPFLGPSATASSPVLGLATAGDTSRRAPGYRVATRLIAGQRTVQMPWEPADAYLILVFVPKNQVTNRLGCGSNEHTLNTSGAGSLRRSHPYFRSIQ